MPPDDMSDQVSPHPSPGGPAGFSRETTAPLSPPTGGGLTPDAEGDETDAIVIEGVTTRHAGPLPSPQTLAAYDQLLPGAADRIIRMAESQLSHQQAFQRDQLTAAKEKMRWEAGSDLFGTLSALIVSVLLIVGGTHAIVIGHPVTGGSIITTTVVLLAAVFVYGRRTGIPRHLVPALVASQQRQATADGPVKASEPDVDPG